MQNNLTDAEIQSLLQKLKQDLRSLKGDNACLEYALDSTAKHIPVSLKIVKGHIEQLAKVLELETHNKRNIENANLAEPVIQLMQLFRELTTDDMDLLEVLAIESRNGAFNSIDPTIRRAFQNEASVVS